MAELKRTGTAVWHGDLRTGNGRFDAGSGAFNDLAYSFRTRFENEPGTNPEELIASAHAACYSMAFANTLASKGYTVESIETEATITLSPKQGGGFEITKMNLDTRGRVPGIDEATFKQIAIEGEKGCPVSNLLRCGLTIELDARLV